MDKPNNEFKPINLGSYDPVWGHAAHEEYSQRIIFPDPPHRSWLQWQLLYIKRFLSNYLGINLIKNIYKMYKHHKRIKKEFSRYLEGKGRFWNTVLRDAWKTLNW